MVKLDMISPLDVIEQPVTDLQQWNLDQQDKIKPVHFFYFGIQVQKILWVQQ